MNRKEIKKEARTNIKNKYFRNVIIVFICACFLSSGFNYTTKNILQVETPKKEINEILNNTKITNSEIIDQILEKTEIEKDLNKKYEKKFTNGVLSTFFNEITKSGSLIFGILNGINKLIFEEKVGIGVIIITGNIILLIFTILCLKTLEVGKKRYFLEKRKYLDTKIDKLLYTYKIKRNLHIAYILFIKNIYEILWSLTIIGGIIKHYEYKMIPYILAENPSITKKEAFKLSKEMTNNNKWNLFKIDISMLGWSILKTLTINLSGIFYSDIYIEAIYAEIYINLRNENIEKNKDKFNDKYLDIEEAVEESYPIEKYNIKTRAKAKWLELDYNKKYTLETYILFFITFAFIGWCWEVIYHLIGHGVFVNRGTQYGPWLPIYGWGGVLIIALLKKFRDNPFKLFIASFILCGIIEYGTAWYLETFKSLKYWDYTGFFLNIHGRICLEGLLLFGIGGCGFVYILAPLLDDLYKKIKPKIKTILCITLIIIFSIDFVYSCINPNTGNGITEEFISEK